MYYIIWRVTKRTRNKSRQPKRTMIEWEAVCSGIMHTCCAQLYGYVWIVGVAWSGVQEQEQEDARLLSVGRVLWSIEA